MSESDFPAATPADPLTEIFPDVFLLRGSVRVGPGMRMGRNMVVLRTGDALTLLNPVRIDPGQLNELGKVLHLIRLGDFHGLDDAFYRQEFPDAQFWCQPGQATYPESAPEHWLDGDTALPVPAAQLFIFQTALFPEAAVFLQEHQLLITTDSVHVHSDWRHTSVVTRWVLRTMGFRAGLVIGPPWLKRVTPPGESLAEDFRQLLELDFQHLVGAHGALLRDDAKSRLRQAVAKKFPGESTESTTL